MDVEDESEMSARSIPPAPAPQARPVQELRAFERVHLDPGESATVTFAIDATQLAFHDCDMNLTVEPGEYELRVGSSAADIRTIGDFEIVGEPRKLARSARTYFSETVLDR
ncbi:fibronectin type III-like domain-contianing protein [Halorhabdus rudnickae]|uniref:fibronectin type III-like domain-contianing protein n=1 Tax=Halorhabdus rudnickae TaxID=1775544 RepID=UPI001FCE4E95|nr:fibronectin type III-like domain-contianing protein [Halorhabdus rudnickae]